MTITILPAFSWRVFQPRLHFLRIWIDRRYSDWALVRRRLRYSHQGLEQTLAHPYGIMKKGLEVHLLSITGTAGLVFAFSWFLHSTFLLGGMMGHIYIINGTIIQYNKLSSMMAPQCPCCIHLSICLPRTTVGGTYLAIVLFYVYA